MQGRRKHKKVGGGGGTGFERHFWNEKGPKKFSTEMLATGEGGGGGREGKINAIINQRPLKPTHG